MGIYTKKEERRKDKEPMKLRVYMKTPDALFYAAKEAVKYEEPPKEELEWYGGDEESWRKDKAQELMEEAGRWFQYEEAVIIEIDTAKGKAKVLEVRD